MGVKDVRIKNKLNGKFFGEQERRRMISYQRLNQEYPYLIHDLISQLMQVDGYSEVVIGFGAGIQVDFVRNIATNRVKNIPPQVFFNILGLYAKVFCDWHQFKSSPEASLS